MTVPGTDVHEVSVVVVFGRIVNSLVLEVLDSRPHPLHIGVLVRHPAACVGLELAVRELVLPGVWRGVGAGGGGNGSIRRF